MKKDRNRFDKLLSILPEGKNHAVSMDRLANILDVNQREIRRAILMLRIEGKIIIGDDAGYYLPSDKSEVRSYYARIMKRQKTTAASVAAVRRALRKSDDCEGFRQMDLSDLMCE